MSGLHKRLTVDYGADDILCVLPIHLIHGILDLVPVRDAARTCILSRKWRYIWSEHPNLVFDKQFFEINFRRNPSEIALYVNAISSVLFLHKGPILKFYLYIPRIDYDWKQHIVQWLLYLSRNGIKYLVLINHAISPSKLPSHVFSCPDLECLFVYKFLFTPPNRFLGFSKLTILKLQKITLNAEVFGSAPLLKKFTLNECTGVEHFKMDTPGLTDFISNWSTGVSLINFERFTNLARLRVIIGKTSTDTEQRGAINLIKFLDKLPKLELLFCDRPFLELFAASDIVRMPSTIFDHMKILNIFGFQFDNVDQMLHLQCFLGTCPNLEKLFIRTSSVLDNAAVPETSSVAMLPDTNLNSINLKIVTISSIRGTANELLFIQSILASSPLLQTMFVDFNVAMDAVKELDISKRLMRFSRASPDAELVLQEKVNVSEGEHLMSPRSVIEVFETIGRTARRKLPTVTASRIIRLLRNVLRLYILKYKLLSELVPAMSICNRSVLCDLEFVNFTERTPEECDRLYFKPVQGVFCDGVYSMPVQDVDIEVCGTTEWTPEGLYSYDVNPTELE